MNDLNNPYDTIPDGSMDALVKHISTNNSDVMRHSMRVATVAVNIGKKMGVSAKQHKSLLHGSLIHDIGYLWVPKSIFKSPRKLALHEKVKIHRHVDLGYYFISRYVDSRDVIDIVKYHHERFDGRGYPHRIGGTAIPLLPRIVAVADAYEAMTDKRAYRPAWKPEAALDNIHEQSGRQFDPDAVGALRDYVGGGRSDMNDVDLQSYDFDGPV
ncbi:MAG: HD domain-containing protein [Spirochaetes bacterium]|nr:HD domain-containing protein [Spirochaetota bacterium]